MSDSKTGQIAFKYFWVKIADKEEVARYRAAGLTEEGYDFLQPQNSGVHPPPLRPSSVVADRRLSIDIGVHLDAAIQANDKYVDVYILDGCNESEARAWIRGKGSKWAGNAFCFLCHASVEFH